MKRGGPLKRKTPLLWRPKKDKTLEKAQRAVQKRSNGLCEANFAPNCTGRGEQVHHVLLRSRGGNKHRVDELLHVCLPCHQHIHAKPLRATELGLMKHVWER